MRPSLFPSQVSEFVLIPSNLSIEHEHLSPLQLSQKSLEMFHGFVYFLAVSTIHAATSPCSDEFSATKCPNDQGDVICQEAFPISEAFPVVNPRCADFKSNVAEECRKQCRSCCQHQDFMCTDKKDSALNCRRIAEGGQCSTTDVTFRAILAVECAASCGLCRYAGCMDKNYLLCSMLQNLCEQPDYRELMRKKCKRTCNLCTVDTQYPGWVFNKETNAHYKFINAISQNENNSAVKYERMCVEEGAHLTSVHSEIENAFVYGLANCERIFIGLRGETSDRFDWLDGSEMDFKNFFPGFPLGSHYCAYISGDNMFWYTDSCFTKGCAVCKKVVS
uniref:C-type lectin domain-containing protein n=1 Tax=Setaria digitata TaxID=48799 RepID=A0A915PHD6_9BILA